RRMSLRWSSSTSLAMAFSNNCCNAPTSLAGRRQFSLENANRVSVPIPRRRQNSMLARTAFWPARWPNVRGRRRARAQRPLPSMTIATCRGTAAARSWLVTSTVRAGGSDRHQLVLLLLDHDIDLLDEAVGELLDVVLGAVLV